MFSRRLKNGYFFIEALNSLATVFFFYYFYYFVQKQFGFGNKANLLLAALQGATYAIFSFFAGKFAQRYGYFTALKVGFITMASAMVLGLVFTNMAPACVLIMVMADIGMCFTWPTLEALVTEQESRSGVQHMVGVYNITWAATAALGNFFGGAVLANLGPKSLFFVPLCIQLIQLATTFYLEREAGASPGVHPQPKPDPVAGTLAHHPPANAKIFLRMAWLANPFAYIGINTMLAVLPGVTLRLGLPTALAGFCGSVWCFSRLAAFAGLWAWQGWHYRFGWLLTAYIVLAGSFITVLVAPNVTILVCAQLLFGAAAGLVYFSSLFYSMDASDTKGEHGGIHEAVIGLGNFTGPALGAASLQLFPPPQYTHSGAYAVTGLLFCGLAGLLALWRSGKTSRP